MARIKKARRADLNDSFARLEGCGADADLVQLAKSCLAAEPGGRPGDAAELTTELTAYLNSVEQRLRRAELDGVEAKARAEEERRRDDACALSKGTKIM